MSSKAKSYKHIDEIIMIDRFCVTRPAADCADDSSLGDYQLSIYHSLLLSNFSRTPLMSAPPRGYNSRTPAEVLRYRKLGARLPETGHGRSPEVLTAVYYVVPGICLLSRISYSTFTIII
jgi:hypothetical protein